VGLIRCSGAERHIDPVDLFPDLPLGKSDYTPNRLPGMGDCHIGIVFFPRPRTYFKMRPLEENTMRNATKTVATWFGIVAGIAGMMHGYYEILHGNTRPEGVVIPSIGPPCVAEEAWNACEPAMTLLPNFLITGILAIIIGLPMLIWSAGFIKRKHGGFILILLSMLLLIFGGGFFPPLIGIIGGIAGLFINKPLPNKEPGATLRAAARLWPWPLVVFLV